MNNLANDISLVKVRIWSSFLHLNRKGQGVGHVSVEIFDLKKMANPLYISFWPRENLGFLNYDKQVKGEFVANFQSEIEFYEKNQSEYVFYFCTFDGKAMKDQYRELKYHNPNYRATASIPGDLFKKDCVKKGFFCPEYNCATFALLILIAGDKNKLLTISRKEDVYSSSSVTPDKLLPILMNAYKKECTDYKAERAVLKEYFKTFDKVDEDNVNIDRQKPFTCRIL